MLMEMDEANKALDKAIDSGDAQLGTLSAVSGLLLCILCTVLILCMCFWDEDMRGIEICHPTPNHA